MYLNVKYFKHNRKTTISKLSFQTYNTVNSFRERQKLGNSIFLLYKNTQCGDVNLDFFMCLNTELKGFFYEHTAYPTFNTNFTYFRFALQIQKALALCAKASKNKVWYEI